MFGQPIGVLVGYGLAKQLINFNQETQHDKNEMYNMHLIEAVLITISALITLVFYRDKPKTPPSETSFTKRVPYRKACRALFKNVDYKYLVYMVSFQNAFDFTCVYFFSEGAIDAITFRTEVIRFKTWSKSIHA